MQLFKNIKEELLNRISESKESLKIAVTWFTNHDLFEAILKKLENPEFKLELIVLNDRINNKREGLDFQSLINAKGNFYYSDVEKMVHHKFCIIDDRILITGSYNWTYYAENRNWENVLILDKPEIIKAFIEEFEKIKKNHEKIYDVSKKQKQSSTISSNEYLETDYIYQAKDEAKHGNELLVAKLYTEILKINKQNLEVVSARNEISKKYNSEEFEVSPFEIGIKYQSGYVMAIPAFEKLPFTIKKTGSTISNYQKNIQATIQKFDITTKTIIQLLLENIKPSRAGTVKIEYQLTLEKSGILKVVCREVDGSRIVSIEKSIKNWL